MQFVSSFVYYDLKNFLANICKIFYVTYVKVAKHNSHMKTHELYMKYRKMILMILFQGSKGDTNIKDRLLDTV